MGVLQKWLLIIGGLSALTLVVSNPRGVATAFNSAQRFISGTDKTAMGR